MVCLHCSKVTRVLALWWHVSLDFLLLKVEVAVGDPSFSVHPWWLSTFPTVPLTHNNFDIRQLVIYQAAADQTMQAI